jgi:TRAP-type C4-dicarboxylate transport system substrate-binding protein
MFGANPTPMPLSEVFVALQTGVMDGQENPLAQIVSSKFHEIQPYLSLTGHVYSPAYVTVNADRWGRLPEDVRLILEETARETQRFVYDTAERMETEFLQEMVDANVVVNEPDLESFVAASQAVYDEFGKSVTGGRALLEHAFSLTSD